MTITNVEGCLKLINPPFDTIGLIRKFLENVKENPNDPALIKEAEYVFRRNNERVRTDIAWLCCDVLENPSLAGAILRQAWTTGNHSSILTRSGYSMQRIINWFISADKQTLMNDSERQVLNDLPAFVNAYRGSCGSLRKAASGLSWSLDIAVAQSFADRISRNLQCEGIVVSATFPRHAILAYMNDRKESELIVKYRIARNIAIYNQVPKNS